MRLIDADALLPMMKYATTDNEIGVFPIKIGFNTIAKVIDDAPTVDAVPVIRCKDCKYNPKQMLVGCPLAGSQLRDDNWYCAWGEKKND